MKTFSTCRYLKTAVCLIAGTLLVRTTTAGEIPPDASLDHLLRHAEEHNTGLQAAFQEWRADLERIPQVGALPDPKLTYGYFLRSVETRVGPQEQRLGVAQTLPWFGKLRLRSEQAAKAAEAGFQRLEARRSRLRFEITDAWHEYAYAHRAIQIVDENIGLLKQLEGVAQAKFKGGGSYLGVVKAQVELGKLDDRKTGLVELLDPIRARLNAALSRPSDASLPRPRMTPAETLSRGDAELLATLTTDNPELRGLSAGIESAGTGVELAKREFYPDVTVGVDYIQTGAAPAPATPGNGRNPVIAMFTINLPLWWQKLRAGVREAESRKLAAEERRSEATHRLHAALKSALFNYRDAERKTALYRDSLVPQARSAVAVSLKAYEAGTADFLETMDTQRLLLEFQLEAERSLANREQRLAEIEMLLGRGTRGEGRGAVDAAGLSNDSSPAPAPRPQGTSPQPPSQP